MVYTCRKHNTTIIVSAGYDKIHLWCDKKPGNTILIPDLIEHQNAQGSWKTGHIKNMRVHISQRGTVIKGSLTKFLLGNNCADLSRSQTKEAIMQLSDSLCLPIKEANVSLLEFGANIILDYAPETYYSYLGPCTRLERFTKPHSVYYQNSYRQFVFYNKKEEAKKELPENWKNLNIMRVETRKLKKPHKQLKCSNITAATLSEAKFFSSMQKQFIIDYHTITKIAHTQISLDKVKTPKDFIDLMFAVGVDSIGGLNASSQLLEEHYARKGFSCRENLSRSKRRADIIYKKVTQDQSSPLLEELTRKIENSI